MTDAAVTASVDIHREVEPGTGPLGMWVFIASEVLFFGGLFVAYIYGRSRFPQGWAAASRETDVVLGTINTAFLLTSSALAALAVACDEDDHRKPWVARLLATTAVIGIVFLFIKGWEWHDEWLEGLVPGPDFSLHVTGAQAFFFLYFVMTGLHGIHVGAGVCVLGVLAYARHCGWPATTPRHVEVAALYWHFVDIVWIVLYPLIYLVSRHG